MQRRCRHARTHRSRLALWLWLALLTLGGLWWHVAAPVEIGGGTSFVIIEGTSMEPLLHDGDLAVARTRPTYAIGDLVVFGVGEGRVIHRIVGGSGSAGWITKGDANRWLDPWPVVDDDVVGAYVARVDGAGAWLVWLLRHPVAFGAVAAAATVATYLPRRPRRVHPVLAAALARSVREPRREGRPTHEYVVLAVLLVATTGTYLVSLLAVLQRAVNLATICAAVLLAVCLVLTWALLHRLYDGYGVPEPQRSVYALSGRLYRLGELPLLPPPVTPTSGAVALRRVAECQRLPVLHHVDGATGRHTFLAITAHDGTFRWTPHLGENPTLGQEAVTAVVRSVAHLPTLPEHARGGVRQVARQSLDADLHHLVDVRPVGLHASEGRVESCGEWPCS